MLSAIEQRVPVLECFVGIDASAAVRAAADACAAAGIPVKGVDVKVGDTVTPQAVFAVASFERRGIEALTPADLVVVGVEISDPGNAGTLIRSAAAAGAGVVVLGAGSVDAYNPKVVRASAGACFAVSIVEGVPAVQILGALEQAGVRRLGATAHGGTPPEQFDLRRPTAFVLGHETHGLDHSLPLDGRVTVPMAAGESLNVAMAATALLFEAARQRRGGP